MSERTYIVAQLGARMHYAVPRILQASGQLEKFYTDICAVQGWPRMLNLIPNFLRPPKVRRLLARVPQGIPHRRITAFNDFGYEYAKRQNSTARQGRFPVHLWAGEEFCRRVLNDGFGRAGGVFTFNTAGLELLQAAKREGLKAVMEQTIAPMRVELKLLSEERTRFSGWETAQGQDELADEFIRREEAEWQVADLIVCGSEFVREGIRQCGGPVEKCVVVPYGVELPGVRRQKPSRRKDSPLRVLTVGAVGLRKGSPYVLAAAKQLKGKAVFRMVGSIGVTREAEAQLREHVALTGVVPRNEIAVHFEWADVFLLPSLCEGSATVTYEALACGLPVICTPNTGSVVREDVDGFIVPIQNACGIAEKLEKLANDEECYARMSTNTRVRAKEFTVAAYGRGLLAALNKSPVCLPIK